MKDTSLTYVIIGQNSWDSIHILRWLLRLLFQIQLQQPNKSLIEYMFVLHDITKRNLENYWLIFELDGAFSKWDTNAIYYLL